jgi:beta,beta-carotene 9',10'-dioxygenase
MSVTASRTRYGKGLTTLESEVAIDGLPVQGELPAWLSGSLIRTGPAQFEAGERSFRHWFDGQAMLHRFGFADGVVSYANKYLATRARAAAKDGRIDYSEFATDPCRSIFKRVTSMFSPGPTDNCNVNVTRLGEEYMALTETPMPVRFDPGTLDALGVAHQPPGLHTSAHPHHDPERGELVGYTVHFGPRSSYRLYAVAPGQEPRVIASLPVREPAYLHSFGMSERYLILAEQPLVVNPLRLALSDRPFIENFEWKPERGSRFHVIDRRSGEVRGSYETEAFFHFHHANAFEEDGDLVVDLVAYDDPEIIDALYLDRLRSRRPSIPPAKLRRYRISLEGGQVESEELAEQYMELPRINYRRSNGRRYRYVYGSGNRDSRDDEPSQDFLNQIIKVDLDERSELTWYEDGCYPGEPVFAPEPEASGEDSGALLSVVLDSARGTSFLLVLDAADLSELARAEVPHHIPFGFHGQFFRDA